MKYSFIPKGFIQTSEGLAHEVTGELWNSDRKFKSVHIVGDAYVAIEGYDKFAKDFDVAPVTEAAPVTAEAPAPKKINTKGKKLF